jgi:O-antigen ligase
MLALTDSRGPSIATALTILLILIPGKAVRRLLPVMVFVPIVLPVVLVGATSGALGQETGLLVGAEQAPVLQLSGRTQIWSAALAELAEPVPGHLVGFGYAGHVAAGLSEQFSQVRSLAADPNSLGAHNLVLQLVLDSGYFGAALMLLTLGLIIRDLGRLASVDDNGLGTVFLGLMCYSVLIGALERVPTVYTEELFVLMLLTAGYVIGRQAAVTAGGVGPN